MDEGGAVLPESREEAALCSPVSPFLVFGGIAAES